MSAAKHTSGEWEVRGEFMTRYIYARGENISGVVATVNLAWPLQAQQEEQEANARLLGAAPKLLAALVNVINEGLPLGPGYKILEAEARAAIAKATGGVS